MKTIKQIGVVCVCIFVVTQTCFGASSSQLQAIDELMVMYPQVKTYFEGLNVSSVYGTVFGTGYSHIATAETFIQDHCEIFGVLDTELSLEALENSVGTVQPIKYDPVSGNYSFSMTNYQQFKDGIPVFRSRLRLLTRNDVDNSLVLATSSTKNLLAYIVDPLAAAADENQVAQNYFDPAFPNPTYSGPATKVIWAGASGAYDPPTVGVEFIRSDGGFGDQTYQYVIDILTSDLLLKESLVDSLNISGNTSGLASEGLASAVCEAEVSTPLPYLKVYTDEFNYVYTDSLGNFELPNAGADSITVYSDMKGLYFQVKNWNFYPDSIIDIPPLSMVVTPPGPVSFVFNASNLSETELDAVNAYYHANKVRDLVLKHNPSFPNVYNRNDFELSVMQQGCGASYYVDYVPPRIGFRRGSGSCNNSAFSTIVHHEYGHHLHWSALISGGGSYSEGIGDALGILMTDDPRLALGFADPCDNYIRNGDTDYQFPCGFSAHVCAQLLSGCIWSLRNELKQTNAGTYLDILGDLTINQILLQSGNSATPQMSIDFLILDDDDNNLENGTPHYSEIRVAFAHHNMSDFDPLEIFVDGITGDDSTGDGTSLSPFKTIQKGIETAHFYGDKVSVMPGIYFESISFLSKRLEVRSTQGPLFTSIVDTTQAQSDTIVKIDSVSELAVLQGFTISGGDIGIHCGEASPILRGNILVGQKTKGVHLGLRKVAFAGGLGFIGLQATLENNTILDGQGIAIYSSSNRLISASKISNNIIAGNSYGLYWEESPSAPPYVLPDISYNDFYNNTNGDHNITPDPATNIFVDPLLKSNHKLQITSPCIDAGDPDPSFNDPDGSRNDIGAIPYSPDTIYVPVDFSTIQEAIDSSYYDGDFVLVDSGTYQENNIDFLGKAITVKGVGSPWATTITTNVQGTLVLFRNDEDSNSVLDGFRLLGGGMAVICYNAGPTIIRCLFKDQVPSTNNEGALNLWGATYNSVGTSPAKIINCTFMGSSRSGIVDRSYDPPVIKNTIVYDNAEYGINWDTYLNKPSEAPELSYNCVNGNGTDYGGGITDSGIGSLHINPNLTPGGSLWLLSTVIDLGDPDPIYNDPDGSRNDMGAWPYQEIQEPPPPPPRKPELEEGELPFEFALFQNFPNPFNPVTVISFSLPVASEYELTIFNILGREVDAFRGHSEPGTVDIYWDASAYGSGIYLYRLTAGTYTATKKMIVLK